MLWKSVNWKVSTAFVMTTAAIAISPVLLTLKVTPQPKPNFYPAVSSSQTFKASGGWIYAIAISPDGKVLASGNYRGIINLWNLETGEIKLTLNAHVDAIETLAMSPDGAILASGSWDNRIKIWDVKTGSLLHILKGHRDDIKAMAISPNGEYLASGSVDQTIRIWNLKTGELLKTFDNQDWVRAIAFSPNSQTLATGSEHGEIRIWSLTNEGKYILKEHSNAVEALAFSPDGETLASGSADHLINIWNFKTGQVLHCLEGHQGAILSLAFNPDGQMLASGSFDNTIKLWNPKNGKFINHLSEHSRPVWSVAFNRKGTMLASGSGDETIKLWSIQSEQKPQINQREFSAKIVVSEINDPILIEQLNQTLYEQINQRWRSPLGSDQNLIYRVKVNQDGKILDYQAINSDAANLIPQVSLIFERYSPPQPQNFAEFQVILNGSGILEVSPWKGWTSD